MGYKIVCLDCCKAYSEGPEYNNQMQQSLKCPECGEQAVRFSHRFRPPRKLDTKKWEVVRFLYEAGFRYEHIYEVVEENGSWRGYVKYPETMNAAKEFVEEYKKRLV